MEKYKILVVKVMSKFEIKRIAKSIGASMMVKLGKPTAEEIGTADRVYVTEISSSKVTIFKRDADENRMATIVLRGSTNSMLDDTERLIDDAVNTVKSLTKDNRLLPGAYWAIRPLRLTLSTFHNLALQHLSIVSLGESALRAKHACVTLLLACSLIIFK